MRPFTRLAIWLEVIPMVIFLVGEVFGFGPIAKYREGMCYSLFANTGAPLFWLVMYSFFFFVKPVVSLFAIILKERVMINNYGMTGQ